jgi:hypothetical protein
VTGARLGAVAAGNGGVFVTYATLDIPDTGTAKLRTLSISPTFNSSVKAVPQTDDSTLLAVGGEPSARALIRFQLPARIKDSATVVRATLELTPVSPILGLPTDAARIQARAILTDLGAKSPAGAGVGRSGLFAPPVDTIDAGATTVRFEAVRLVEGWLSPTSRPSALVLSLVSNLEAASFSRPVFYSTRAADQALWPRLRISYLLSFPFENP